MKTPTGTNHLGMAVGMAVALLGATPTFVRAQGGVGETTPRAGANRKAAARALFEEGLRLLEAQHWTAATDRFERARRLHASPRVTYNLTTALLQTGRLVYASELLRELTTTAAVERSVQEAAEQRLQSLQDRLGTLTVLVEGDLNGATVELNGRALHTAMLDVPMPVDPGEHTVVARRDGETLVTHTIAVQEGQRRQLHLAIPARLLRVPTASVMDRAPPDGNSVLAKAVVAPDSQPTSSRTWLWVGVGAAVAASAVVGILLLSQPNATAVQGSAGTATLGAP